MTEQATGREMTAAVVAERLGLHGDHLPWLDRLEALGPPAGPTPLPHGDALRALLIRIGTPPLDADEIVRLRPDPATSPELWWLLERCHHSLIADMGGTGYRPDLPSLPDRLGAAGRFFYVHVFVATIPAVRRFHRLRGVPEDITWATLADLGDKISIHRRTYGRGGLNTQFWFTLCFRGAIYALGRLQFDMEYFGQSGHPGGIPVDEGDPVLGVHIPEPGGPFTPALCDASIARAAPFIESHFPEFFAPGKPKVAICNSWLLDPQLADYVSETSNIVAFQRRFALLPEEHDGDRGIIEFVFRQVDPDLASLPRHTTLQRAVVDHLRAGKHWRARTGWFALPE
ncbi:MAG: acyltransferase domain-containing protein [Mycobacteriales bacterium]